MKIVLLIPDGVGIRNYLYSDIIKELYRQGHEVIVWHALSKRALHEVETLHRIDLHSESLPPYRESAWEKFLRETASYARLRYNNRITDNETIMTNWAPGKKKMMHTLFYGAVETIGGTIERYERITALERKHHKALLRSKYLPAFTAFLKKHTPDVIFNTHQRAIAAIPAIAAAQKLGIRTVTAIYSWDNLPKARLATRTDRYFVWSDYMKEEMRLYYPEIDQNNVIVTGTPQFDFYHDESLYMDKESFCNQYGLDINKKTVCFSGDDRRTSPYDPQYLEDLAEALLCIEESKRPQILFRRCPADFSDRYDAVLSRYKEIIKVADPLWKSEQDTDSWNLFYPAFDDVKLLVNIAKHCDLVYNVGSTMAHDFAMFDKPAAYIHYDQPESKNWSVKTIYAFEHFRSMEGLDAVVWINSKNEIAKKVLQAIDTPEQVAPDRRKWLEIITDGRKDVGKDIAKELCNGV